jgi:hypothetical protein
LWFALQGLVDGREQAFYTGHDKAHVAQFSHDSAVAFYLHMSLLQDVANFGDDGVGSGVGRDVDRFAFAVNKEPQYFFGGVPLSIPTLELFERYGILATCVACDRCWGGNGMDAAESRSGDAAKKGTAFVFDRRANKVVNVDVDPVSGTIGLAAGLGRFGWVHVVFEAMGRELDFVGDKALDDVATCFGCGTEV